MTDNIINFPSKQIEESDLTAEEILNIARSWGLDRCIVLGVDHNGDFRWGGNMKNTAELLYTIELAKINTIEIIRGDKT